MKLITLIILVFSSLNCFSQCSWENQINSNAILIKKKRKEYQDTVWTVAGWKTLDSRYKKWKPDFDLDARQTAVGGQSARLAGIRIGVEHRRVHHFGLASYNFGQGVVLANPTQFGKNVQSATVNLSYLAFYYERVLLFHRKWEWSAAIHSGGGNISGNYRLAGSDINQGFNYRVQVGEISTLIYFNPTYFSSIGFGLGYRAISDIPAEFKSIYNSPVLLARAQIKIIKMVRGFFSKDVRNTY
jgi:hypothetical protein